MHLEYTGKTTQDLHRTISKHVGDMTHEADTPESLHINVEHKGDPTCMKFTGRPGQKVNVRGDTMDFQLKDGITLLICRNS